MGKSPQVRLSDSLSYIQTHISVALAHHIRTLVAGQESTTGAQLHLGQSKVKGPNERAALRALLLCQYVYFSGLWTKMFGMQAKLEAANYLSADWKDASIRYWATQPEINICDAIRMFTVTSTDTQKVAKIASRGALITANKNNFISVVREEFCYGYTGTCYMSVMFWLFNSGLVSLPWLLRFANANTRESLTQAFGQGYIIYQREEAITDSNFPVVSRGNIVHIYKNSAAWNGHWMISLGNNRAVGANNNDEFPPVNRLYCNQLNLEKQFLGNDGGFMVSINPLLIPAVF